MEKLETTFKQYYKDIYRYSYFTLRNKEQAEDITSETFRKLIEQPNIEKIENMKAWLITVSKNLIRDKFSKKTEVIIEDTNSFYEEVPDKYENVEDLAISEELMQIILKEMENLDNFAKEVVVLKIWEDLTFAEIASMNKISENTVKQKFYRSIEKIKINVHEEQKFTKAFTFSLPAVLMAIKTVGGSSQFAASPYLLTKLLTLKAMNVATGAGILAKLGITSTAAQVIAVGTVTTTLIAGGAGVVAVRNANDQKENTQNNVTIQKTTSYPEGFEYVTQIEKTCENNILGVKFKYLNDWTCETKDLDSSQSYTYFRKGNYSLSIGTGAIGYNCPECSIEEFYKSDSVELDVYRKDNAITTIMGHYNAGKGGQIILKQNIEGSEFSTPKVIEYVDEIKFILSNIRSFSASEDVSDTSSWTNFIDSKSGYSIKYPGDMSFNNSTGFNGVEYGDCTVLEYNSNSHIFIGDLERAVASYCQMNIDRTKPSKFTIETNSGLIINGSKYTASGTISPGGPYNYYILTFKNKNNKTITVSMSYLVGEEQSYAVKFDTILKSITLTDMEAATTPRNLKTYSLYFPNGGGLPSDFQLVAVNRSTDRTDVATFLMEEYFKGPTDAEKAQGLQGFNQEFTGNSFCGGNVLSLSISDRKATLTLCKQVAQLNSDHQAPFRTAVAKNISQFGTVDTVIIRDFQGNCFADMSGMNMCLKSNLSLWVPQTITQHTRSGYNQTGVVSDQVDSELDQVCSDGRAPEFQNQTRVITVADNDYFDKVVENTNNFVSYLVSDGWELCNNQSGASSSRRTYYKDGNFVFYSVSASVQLKTYRLEYYAK